MIDLIWEHSLLLWAFWHPNNSQLSIILKTTSISIPTLSPSSIVPLLCKILHAKYLERNQMIVVMEHRNGTHRGYHKEEDEMRFMKKNERKKINKFLFYVEDFLQLHHHFRFFWGWMRQRRNFCVSRKKSKFIYFVGISNVVYLFFVVLSDSSIDVVFKMIGKFFCWFLLVSGWNLCPFWGFGRRYC